MLVINCYVITPNNQQRCASEVPEMIEEEPDAEDSDSDLSENQENN